MQTLKRFSHMTFALLANLNRTRSQAWDPQGQSENLFFRAVEMGGEVGEFLAEIEALGIQLGARAGAVLNHAKKLERERIGIRGGRTTVQKAGDELGDVVITAINLARVLGVDLGEVVAEKFNSTSDRENLPIKIPESRPVVIVESPFAGNVELNLAYARAAMRDCLLRGEAPFASHALYTQPGVLDDNTPDERALGIEAGFAFRHGAQRTVVYEDLGLSRGMRLGIEHAETLGQYIERRSLKDWEICKMYDAVDLLLWDGLPVPRNHANDRALAHSSCRTHKPCSASCPRYEGR